MCPDFSQDMSIRGIEGTKGPKLLIMGAYGSGKSKLMERLITKLGSGIRVGGYYTRDIMENGEKVGIKIVTVDKQEGVLAHVKSESRVRVGKFGVNLEDIEKVAVPSIQRAIMEDAVVMIDEIGRMELYSGHFRDAVEDALDSTNPMVATVQEEGSVYASEIKSRAGVRVLHLDLNNRDDVLRLAADILSGS